MEAKRNTLTRNQPRPPRDSLDFRVAIICALPLEASAVGELFDTQCTTKYAKVPGDSNAYSTGAIGPHNVVLVHMPNMGKVAAATAAAGLRATFPGIQLALVVGICGGVPSAKQSKRDILLGDVVISEGLVQYDFGRQYPDNRFLRKDSARDNLPRPRPDIRSVLAKLQTESGKDQLQEQTSEHLKVLQHRLSRGLVYPGASEDRLFRSGYQHRHHRYSQCDICANHGTCDESIDKDCQELGCSELELVSRTHQSLSFMPEVHLGLFASGDTVMKSGDARDEIATRDGVLAFEMEGAGIWEAFPTVLIIKGVCDYADSHKNKKWQAYAAATAASAAKAFLEDWRTDSRGVTHRLYSAENKHKRSIIEGRQIKTLEKLYACPYRDRKDRNPERVPGTCEWFTTHDLFQHWRNSDSARLLWVSADPGCGKSVLGRYLVDSCIPTSESRTTCYFFFKNDFEDQRTVTGALCCILHQLFFQNRGLLSESILEQFETKPTINSSFGELWDILIRATQDKSAGQVVCFLDALDECEEDGRSQLIQAICKLYTTDSSCNVKFLLTSRPYNQIRRQFRSLEETLPVIHLSGENEEEIQKISREIDIFVAARVKDVGKKMGLRREEQTMLSWKLTRVPNRTYLWVYLTLDFIESSIDIDKATISEITSQLPETVNDAYEQILSKSRDVVRTRRLLHIIVAAARPLTLEEMNVALAFKKSDTSIQDLDLRSAERFRTVLRDLCGLFVVIVDSKIYLLHQTAKEFLLTRRDESPISRTRQWEHSLVLAESDRILTEICMGYLLFEDFNTLTHAAEKTYVFLDYSAKRWVFHLHGSDLNADTMVESLLKLCDAGSKRCQTWWRLFWDSNYDESLRHSSSLSIVSCFGFQAAVKTLLRTPGMNLRSKDDIHDGRRALQWAATNGYEEIVKLLLKGPTISIGKSVNIPLHRGARVDSKDKTWQTPLSLASNQGHTKVVKLLIDKGADLESEDMRGQSPLLWAAQDGHAEVVEILAAAGANLDTKDIFDQTPLSHAAENKHEAIMAFLLDKGATIEARDDDAQTALSWSAKTGHVEGIALLLDRGAAIDSKDRFGQSPLSLAARRGHREAVRLLLGRGADVKSRDRNGRTPLDWAGMEDHGLIEQLLRDKVSEKKIAPLVLKLAEAGKMS